MRRTGVYASTWCLFSALFLTACATMNTDSASTANTNPEDEQLIAKQPDYSSRIPQHIDTYGERAVVVDPNVHVWGAYDANGDLMRAGLAVAGADWCSDLGRQCHTSAGSFRVFSLGDVNCQSSLFPIPRGGAPLPYCK